MPCTALNIPVGTFAFTNWSSASSGGGGGISVNITGGSSPVISWSGPNGSGNQAGASGDLFKFIFWNNKFLLVLQSKPGAGNVIQHAVFLGRFRRALKYNALADGGLHQLRDIAELASCPYWW